MTATKKALALEKKVKKYYAKEKVKEDRGKKELEVIPENHEDPI